MPATALLLVLLAALAHAAWNLAAKRASGDQRFLLVTSLMVTVLWAPAALWSGWHELPRWGPVAWAAVTASAAVHLLYFSALLKGYRVGDLTVVYPVARGAGPLLTVLLAVVWLGESLSLAGAAGAVAVCTGVFLIAGGPALWRPGRDPAQRARTHAGLRWGLFTGVFIAGYSALDGYAVKVLALSPVLFHYLSNVLRVPMTLPAVWHDRPGVMEALRTQWRPALAVAVLSPAAYILVLYAVTLAPLSHVAPAREVSMLLASLLAGRLLGEAERGLRLLGAGCIAAGVAALALAPVG
jgi:drug/metabolite transporter (DMT)-like permease